MKKKVISLLLVAVMLIGILPLQAMATGTGGVGYVEQVALDVTGGEVSVKVRTGASQGNGQNIYYGVVTAKYYTDNTLDIAPSTVCGDFAGAAASMDAGTFAYGQKIIGTSSADLEEVTPATNDSNAEYKLAKKAENYYLLIWSENGGVDTAANVYAEPFKTDSKGDLYTPTITMPTGGDLKIGAAREISIALNGVIATDPASSGTYTEIANDEALTGVTVTGADADGNNSAAISGATVVYVHSTADKNASIKVTVPDTYMVEANVGKKITVELPGTITWTDDAGTAYVAAKNDSGAAINSSVFAVAADAQQNFAVANDAAATFGDEPITLTTSGGNGDGAVSFAITTDPATGVATLSGSTLTITGVGKVTVTATKATHGTYKTATATKDIVIGKATPDAKVTETKVTEAGKKLSEVVTPSAKGVDGNELPGNFTWTKEDGTPIADITAEEVTEQTTYKWTFTPDASVAANYTTKQGTVTPWGESKATVTFEVDTAKGSIPDGKGTAEVKKNAPFEASFPTVTPKAAYTFKGWAKKNTTTIVDVKTVTVDDDTIFVAMFEDKEFHKAIMVGKGNDEFKPNDNLKRSEAAMILSRLYEGDELFNEKADPVQHAPTGFTDVNAPGAWFYGAVGFAQNKNLITGATTTEFKPDANISRAEFAVMLTRMMTKKTEAPEVDVSKTKMTGIQGHWAEKYIVYLELETGAIKGKVGTDFKPNDKLTRAEAAKMMNGVVGRLQSDSPKEEDQLSADLNIFTDVVRNTWYYNNVIEATVGHYTDDREFHAAK